MVLNQLSIVKRAPDLRLFRNHHESSFIYMWYVFLSVEHRYQVIASRNCILGESDQLYVIFIGEMGLVRCKRAFLLLGF